MPYVLRGSLGEEYRIETQARIGRDASNQIVLPDLLVSRVHATVMLEHNELRVVDNGSSNGTLVNGARVTQAALKPGDIVQFGNTPLTVAYLPDPAPPVVAQTVVRGQDPYAAPPAQNMAPPPQAYPAPAYGQVAPVYTAPPALPAYTQPAQAYPQPVAPGYGQPVYAAPPKPKKSALGRILLVGCLLPIALCALLSLGGFVALRTGIISLTALGLGPGDISVENRRGDAIRVAIVELAPPSGEAPIRASLLLNASDQRAYRVNVPGRYQVDFALESNGAKLGFCLLTVKSGGSYTFTATTDAVTAASAETAGTPAQNIATSVMCR
jgi:hypothetical protein